jgi:uncharacterized protein
MTNDAIRVDHRPWPMPARPWVMSMCWRDLAFLHWRVPVSLLRDHIPAGLEIDTFDNTAWLGLVPFAMEAVCPRFTPRIPPVSDFAELNLRTYVQTQGKPGVFFFSLDAASWLGVRLARSFFHLPYFDARIHYQHTKDGLRYESTRVHRGATPGRFAGLYRPTGPVALSKPGSLEHWLTERYCLYSASPRGVIYRGDIHHDPWPLQPAECELEHNEIGNLVGIPLGDPPKLVHFAEKLDVRAWLIEPIAR